MASAESGVLAHISASWSSGLAPLIVLPQRHFRTHFGGTLEKSKQWFPRIPVRLCFSRLKSLESECYPPPSQHSLTLA